MNNPTAGPGGAPDRGPAPAARDAAHPALVRCLREALRRGRVPLPADPDLRERAVDAWFDLWATSAARYCRLYAEWSQLDRDAHASARARDREAMDRLEALGHVRPDAPSIASPLLRALADLMEGPP